MRINCVLECNHIVQIDHRNPTDQSYCRTHGIQPIIERWTKEWRAICLTCTWARWCGTHDNKLANREARHHLYTRKDHDVEVLYDNRVKPTPRKFLQRRAATAKVDLFNQPTVELPPPF